ncbi:MAG: hypothetical protein RSB96_04090 [Oscillospiraceae bacterium]
MTNNAKFVESYSDLVAVLYNLTAQISEYTDYTQMLPDLDILDKLTTNLKRMSETLVLEVGGIIQEDINSKEGSNEEI